MLTASKEKKGLIMYLAAAKEAISTVLMTERDGKQMPIYFVSRALQGSELNYTLIEKLILALILADFIVERLEDDPLDTPMEDKEELPDPWVLFTEGSSCIDDSGVGLIITNPEGMKFTYGLRRVANRVNGIYVAKELGMIKYLDKVKTLASAFKEFSIKQVPRGENKKVDALSKMTSTSFAHLSKQVLVEERKEKSINEKEVLAVVEEEGRTWMTPIYEYFTEEILPERGRQEPYAARPVDMRMHAGPISVVTKALRSGYCWLTMHADARNLIRECSSCQVHRPVPRNPEQKLTSITSPWTFYKWGIDIAGPFPKGLGKVKFMIVAIDYFTKWIEAKPVATITGAQFRDNPFKDWREKLCIRQCFASVKHPQANGLVERANRSLGEGINARPFGRKKRAGSNSGSKKAKPRWKNTIMPGFAAQVSGWQTSSTGTIKQAVRNMETRLDLNGKDHMKSQKHWAKERTSLETATGTPFREHGMSATLRNAMCMKCKHLSHWNG
ncbi:reverse transcriptase domain-containing protein [Tanacetum coccineum]|uniref:Reverse transcriptase domain-containing protein n=1 Tax=Tanacetum coccineum TaxID=301880 RepID=A0ABQ5AVG1_9ASTR